jgi:hypothetical protein
MTESVKMTKDNGGGTVASADVPVDQVAIWKADGWKVAEPVKVKK